jgi:diacylglycerol kinase (ATP)
MDSRFRGNDNNRIICRQTMKTKFIINPKSAGGKTGKKWNEIFMLVQKTFANDADAAFTEGPMHAVQLTKESIQGGYDSIIAVGGDGTINEVLNGFFENDQLLRDDVTLGVLEMGTGADFIRSLNMPTRWEEAIPYLKQANPQKVDIGKAIFHPVGSKSITDRTLGVSGQSTISRYFINICDFGIGGAVVERTNRTTKLFGGKITFLWSILITLLQYKNQEIRYKLDNDEWQTGMFNNFIIANGRYFGGGLNPAPNALLDDGLFDVVFFGDIGRIDATANLSNLRKGTHLKHPKISVTHAKTIEAAEDNPVYIDMDGELVGILPIQIEILPKKLSLLR